MQARFFNKIAKAHYLPKALPGEKEIDDFILLLLQFLFPELNDVRFQSHLEIETAYNQLRIDLEQLLLKTKACHTEDVSTTCQKFFDGLEDVYDCSMADADAILAGDPAAHDGKEVIRCYPGFFAIAIYRIAHHMLRLGIPYLPRIFTEYAHARTGIDIHPAAEIGARFCIDHGTGIVIGETSTIGDDVKIYQGVTLGALSVTKEQAKIKRHPTIENGVVIYAGATILGGKTVIGTGSTIGGNVWITESVSPNARIYYNSSETQVVKEKTF